jgi:hypothetical protein
MAGIGRGVVDDQYRRRDRIACNLERGKPRSLQRRRCRPDDDDRLRHQRCQRCGRRTMPNSRLRPVTTCSRSTASNMRNRFRVHRMQGHVYWPGNSGEFGITIEKRNTTDRRPVAAHASSSLVDTP